MKWKIDKPYALTWEQWDDWRDSAKKHYPVRFFIQESIPKWFSHNIEVPIFWRIRDRWYNVKYRFIRKHQYNVIRPRTLQLGYHDERNRLLHANMECLSGFLEHGVDHVNWEGSSEAHGEAYREMIAINTWWTLLWPDRDDITPNGQPLTPLPSLPEEWGEMSILNKKYRNEPIMLEFSRVSAEHSENRHVWDQEEVDMLKRLMEIHQYLWD